MKKAAAGVAVLAAAGAFALAGSSAAPASGVASRVVTFTFSDSGKGRWSTSGDTDKGSMAMNYSWKGTAKFRIPTSVLRKPTSKFSVNGTASLTGNWVGDFVGQQFGTATAGPYHCTYKGTGVKTVVDTTLHNARKRGMIEIEFHARSTQTGIYFFPSTGAGTSQQCATSNGAQGPPHFSPGSLFRDSFNIGGQLTSQTALIDVTAKVLPRGSQKIAFPREIGTVDTPLRPKLTWHNVGALTVKAR